MVMMPHQVLTTEAALVSQSTNILIGQRSYWIGQV